MEQPGPTARPGGTDADPSRPRVITTVEGIRAEVRDRRVTGGTTVGLVPTMGALHEGHLSLARAARAADDVVVASIFVNPLQFAPGEDLGAYPRTLEADLDLLAAVGVDLVFHPDASGFLGPDAMTIVHVEGVSTGLEGASRPTHFDGVTTIVAKLLNTVGPDHAYFGEKDFQQQAIINRMVLDLNIPTTIVTCPVVRELDGLAMSSRNRYLTDQQREDALVLSQALTVAQNTWEHDADSVRSLLVARLEDTPGIRLDYAEVVDPVTLEPLEGIQTGPAQVVLAAYVGETRLLDTVRLEPRDK